MAKVYRVTIRLTSDDDTVYAPIVEEACVERTNVPDGPKCVEYLQGHLDKWCTIVGAIHEGFAAAAQVPMPPVSDRYIVQSLTRTCEACPAQWEGKLINGTELYIRYRFGQFRIDVAGVTVYREDLGDGLDGTLTDEAMRARAVAVLDFSLVAL